jgi:pimeloyl-ACP methyl ester carboxylesterase
MAIRRPEQFTHFEAELPGIRIHYVREGSGPTLLLMHGWPGFWWEWHKCIGELAKSFDVIVPDLRGYGDSEKPDLNDLQKFHLDVVTDDQANLLEYLGIERAYVVGHDYSALVMHKFVRKYRPLVIRGLTIDPIVPGFESRYLSVGHFPESWYSQFHQLDMAVDLVSSSWKACETYFKHFLSHWSYDKNVFTDEELEIYTDNFMKPGNIHGGFNYYRANLSIRSQPWTGLDQTISDLPMTFLQGMGDTVVPSVWTNLVADWYNNYTIEYVPDGGHFLMIEKPELVVDRIRKSFLAA